MSLPLTTVLGPKWRTARARLRQDRASGGRGKAVVLGTVGLVFWLVVFGVLYRMLAYFRSVEEIGPLLAGKLLGLALLSFCHLLLSNVDGPVVILLAKDLELLVAAPVDWLISTRQAGETICAVRGWWR
jgi:ABC-2 type transport system permease protein